MATIRAKDDMGFIYRTLLKGLLTLLPVGLTIALFIWIKSQAESVFAEPLRAAFPEVFGFPGAGLLVGLVVVFLAGLFVNAYLTRPLAQWFDQKLTELPIIRAVYSPIRDLTRLFTAEGRNREQRVVMVRLEAGGVELMGLVTRENFTDLPEGTVGADSIAVFLPFSYGMGGMTVVVPRSRVRETRLSAERAMQLSITGWIRSTKT